MPEHAQSLVFTGYYKMKSLLRVCVTYGDSHAEECYLRRCFLESILRKHLFDQHCQFQEVYTIHVRVAAGDKREYFDIART